MFVIRTTTACRNAGNLYLEIDEIFISCTTLKSSPFKFFSEEFKTECWHQDRLVSSELLEVTGEGEVVSLQQLLRVVAPHLPAAGGEEEQLQVQQRRAQSGPGPGREDQVLAVVQDVVHGEVAVQDGYKVPRGFREGQHVPG